MENKARIILIAAIGKNRELGKGPELVWKLSEDLKRFKNVTKGHPVIMGKRTFDSIGRVLPKRVNIIITRDTTFRQEGAVVVHSVEQALEAARNLGTGDIYVIGGGEIYRQTLPFADRLDLTLVDAEDSDADVFFPEFEDQFKKVSEGTRMIDGEIAFRSALFERK